MLKDALKQLIEDNENGSCRVGAILSSTDSETAELLKQVLASDIATVNVVKILQGEGFKISRETLRTKRNDCFRTENPPASCCMSKKADGSHETAK
jgi:hypothetical protein